MAGRNRLLQPIFIGDHKWRGQGSKATVLIGVKAVIPHLGTRGWLYSVDVGQIFKLELIVS